MRPVESAPAGFVPSPYRPPAPPVRPLGVTPLRPLSGREIVAGGWRVRQRDAKALSWPSLAVVGVIHVLGLVVWSVFWPFLGSAPGVYVGVAGTVLLVSVAQVFLVGLVSVVVDRGVAGRPVTGSEVWREIGPVRWRLLGLSACCGAAVPVGLVLGVVPGVLLWVAFSLSAPALVRERLTIRRALARSRTLVRGMWKRTSFVLAAATALSGVVVGVLVYVPAVLSWGGGRAYVRIGDVPIQWLFFTALYSFTWSCIVAPVAAAAVSMLYVDRRFAEQAGLPAPRP